MKVFNGYIRKDKLHKDMMINVRTGRKIDVFFKNEELINGKTVVKVYEAKTYAVIGKVFLGYKSSDIKIGGSCEINIDRITWDHGIYSEGHITVVFRDYPNAHGNTILIHEDQPTKGRYRETLGSGRINDNKGLRSLS